MKTELTYLLEYIRSNHRPSKPITWGDLESAIQAAMENEAADANMINDTYFDF